MAPSPEDLHTFKATGRRAIGLQGAPSAVALARAHSGCEVLGQSLLHLELPSQSVDGVFANAVLFHLPSQVLPRVLRQLRQLLESWWGAVRGESAGRHQAEN